MSSLEQLNIFSEVVCDYKSSLVKIFNPVSSDDELKDNMIFICEDSQLHNYQIKSKNLSLICLTETCEDNENNKFYCPKDDLELINIYINLIDYKKIKINKVVILPIPEKLANNTSLYFGILLKLIKQEFILDIVEFKNPK